MQQQPLGTGDAVRSARAALEGRAEDVLVLSGDTPLITPELLHDLVETHRAAGRGGDRALVRAGRPRPVRTGSAGRERRASRPSSRLSDASDEQLAIREVNSSIYVFRADRLWPVLDRLEPKNAQGELYLTDSVGFLVADGETVAVHTAPDPMDALGVNTRVELAAAAATLRDRINERHMLAGVTIVDPASTWIEPDVEIEPDAVVHPFTVIRGSSKVAAGADVRPARRAHRRGRGRTRLGGPVLLPSPRNRARGGSESRHVRRDQERPHRQGREGPTPVVHRRRSHRGREQFGAGSITANFPHQEGLPKGKTTIGRNVRVGVNTVFLAPVEVGDDAWTAAGSVIEEDVPPNALAIARARQVTKEGRGGKKNGGDGND